MKKHVRFKCAEAKRLGLDEVIVAEGSVQGYQGDGTSPVPKTNPHVLRQSATDLPWKCNHCVETFPTHARLTGHLAVHSGDLYRCRYCSAPFAHVHTRGESLTVSGETLSERGRLFWLGTNYIFLHRSS